MMSDDELRAHLLGLGARPDQVEGLAEGDLIGLAGDLQLSGGLDLDLQQLSAAAGCRPGQAREVYELLGLRVEELAGFGDDDVALVAMITGDTTGFIEKRLAVASAPATCSSGWATTTDRS